MSDLSSLVKNDLVNAFNDHDLDRALQYFDDNAVVNFAVPPPGFPKTLNGKNEIRRYFQSLMSGGHVDLINVKSSGDRVEWTARLTSDLFKNSGLKDVEINNWATIKNNKITSFNPTFPPNVIQVFQQQGTQTGTRPSQR